MSNRIDKMDRIFIMLKLAPLTHPSLFLMSCMLYIFITSFINIENTYIMMGYGVSRWVIILMCIFNGLFILLLIRYFQYPRNRQEYFSKHKLLETKWIGYRFNHMKLGILVERLIHWVFIYYVIFILGDGILGAAVICHEYFWVLYYRVMQGSSSEHNTLNYTSIKDIE